MESFPGKCSVSKIKLPLTPLQLGLCLLGGAGLIFCAAGDIFLLLFDRGTVSRSTVTTNLVLTVLAGLVCNMLVFRAGEIDLFDKDEQGDKVPAVTALRTYFCMIEFDITVTLILMLMGIVFWSAAGRVITVVSPLLFLAAGGIYFHRTGRLGGTEETDEPEVPDDSRTELMKKADELIAEEHVHRTAESILADIKADIGVQETDTHENTAE